MSTYSHLSVIKTDPVKSSKINVKRKNRKPGYQVTSSLAGRGNNSLHMWYSNKAYPVLAD